MNETNINESKIALRYFVNLTGKDDKISIIKFNETILIIQNLTSDKDLLLKKIDEIPNISYGNTAFYDAIYEGVTLLKEEKERKAVIGFTDGVNTAGIHGISDTIEYAQLQNIPAYLVGIGEYVDPTVLSYISNQTGGRYYYAANSSVLSSIYAQISQTLNFQYLVTYRSCRTCDGTQRNLTVQVSYGNFSGSNSKTYYAPTTCNDTVYYTINATSGQGGSIDPYGQVQVLSGTNQTFTITANSCYTISDIITNNTTSLGPQSSPFNYTFTNVTENQSIEAQFTKKIFTINSVAGAGGSIDPLGTVQVECGSDQLYSILPAQNYDITDLLVDGVSMGSTRNYTFHNVSENHQISVNFTRIPAKIHINASTNTWGKVYPYGNKSYPEASNQSFITQVRPGATMNDVTVDNTTQGIIPIYPFTNISTEHTINVNGSPTVGQIHVFFNATPKSGTSPTTVTFTDETLGEPTSWYWQFGDGATSTEQNPRHTYIIPGKYSVTLRAYNDRTSGDAFSYLFIEIVNP